MAVSVLAPGSEEVVGRPTFHLAPTVVDAPSLLDEDGSASSAQISPHTQLLDARELALDTAQLTAQLIEQQARGAPTAIAQSGVPAAVMTVYTPAQIRSAYELPTLPAASSPLTAAQQASLGSGQTIYLIDAFDNPNASSDLATFSRVFGLPACTTTLVSEDTKLPLGAPEPAACTFSVVYVNENGLPGSRAPAYDASWATEIAIDVQWAHATAPLARIVLLEAQGASVAQLAQAIELATRMGPGIVSMSFGAAEGAWASRHEGIFASSVNSFVASTGDSGSGVCWPSTSANVLAVGGTTLSFSGAGTRKEVAWSRTGGGLSSFQAQPEYQRFVAVPGLPSAPRYPRVAAGPEDDWGRGHARLMRAVADVSFNADPFSGQFLAMTTPGEPAPKWYSAGGTSLGVPQWAGLLAISNAQRAQAGLAPLGLAQVRLYENIAPVKGWYAGAFLDITAGADGSCASCRAGPGYDLPTGLGTPNASDLLGLLTVD